MALTSRVNKFALSIDPDELVDFEEPLSYYEKVLRGVGMEQVNPYRWRLKDQECTITADIEQSTDGYIVWLTVQAVDAHAHRVAEIANAFDAYLLSSYTDTRSINRR